MLKVTHIAIAKRTLAYIEKTCKVRLNKTAYLFGSIAPDINCVYPTHTVDNTLKRFKKRILRVDNSSNNLIISFTLGVITHYICDYFCYAHNLKRVDPMHAVYERLLREHIKLHEKSISISCGDELTEQWEMIKEHIAESISSNKDEEITEERLGKVIEAVHYRSADHIEYIIETLMDMHKTYMEESESFEIDKWYKQKIRMIHDEQYSEFMCNRILTLILNPNIELQRINAKYALIIN